jgi:hypothetical protein
MFEILKLLDLLDVGLVDENLRLRPRRAHRLFMVLLLLSTPLFAELICREISGQPFIAENWWDDILVPISGFVCIGGFCVLFFNLFFSFSATIALDENNVFQPRGYFKCLLVGVFLLSPYLLNLALDELVDYSYFRHHSWLEFVASIMLCLGGVWLAALALLTLVIFLGMLIFRIYETPIGKRIFRRMGMTDELIMRHHFKLFSGGRSQDRDAKF